MCLYFYYSLLSLDLAEVMSVTPAPPAPGPPKKTDDKSFFDVSNFLFIIPMNSFDLGRVLICLHLCSS